MIPIAPEMGVVEMNGALGELQKLANAAGGLLGGASGADAANAAAPSFGDTLKAAIADVNSRIETANHAAMSYAAGNHAMSLSDVMVALEKANLAFQTAATVRDRVAEAYSSVMNMQV